MGRKTTTWWRVTEWNDAPEPVQVLKETAKMLLVKDFYGLPGNNVRTSKADHYRTWEEARAAFIARRERAAFAAECEYKSRRARLDAAYRLPKQEEAVDE